MPFIPLGISMHLENEILVFSPSDITLFMESPFASWMEHAVVVCSDLTYIPDPQDPMMTLLQEKGISHELAVLQQFKDQGLTIADLSSKNVSEATLEAMRLGVDIIYQGTLNKSPFYGRADFLVKVAGSSALGNYHYEVWDAKLSKTVKPNFIVQLCCYADMLENIQQHHPEHMTVILSNYEHARLKIDHYFYYYQQLKRAFLSIHSSFSFEKRPDPSCSISWGRWKNYAEALLLNADHLSQIATITRNQIKKLNQAEIYTVQQLIESDCQYIAGINSEELRRLKTQARLQKQSMKQDRPLFEIIIPAINQKQGLALLPPHSPLDVFFDIEGFPLEEGGLEYLWGSAFLDADGILQFKDFWAHNSQEEQLAFKSFIDWVYQRWQMDPTMHIYHYANYEIAACRRLMGRYGICEYEVDQLLRNEVFVDLYKIVKGGLLVGEPKYSIKNIEHLYRGNRETAIGSGGDSVVIYETWRMNPDGQTWQTSAWLNDIREYNIDDCYSTKELVDWLRARQTENNISYCGKIDIVEPEVKEAVTNSIQLRNDLLEQSRHMLARDPKNAAVIENLAWSLEFHRRENKPVFWRLFDRLGLSDNELVDDLDCLTNCVRTEKVPFKLTSKARSLAYEYQFDPNQEFKGISENYYVLGETTTDGKYIKVTIEKDASDLQQGIIVIKAKEEPPTVMTLIPDEFVHPHPIPAAIYRVAKSVAENPLNQSAITDFMRRNIPRIKGHQHGMPIAPSQDAKERIQQISQAIINLDHSYLVIQGPPGAGKTYTGKHVIAELLTQGKTIGICSNSHKAINHLLKSVATYCMERHIHASFFCTKETDSTLLDLGVTILENSKLAAHITEKCVVGTTAWGFARDDLANTFDYLFIDEAGQVSIANLIAISQSAKNIVLMGDQMQLSQPSQGSHPAESGLSILDYLLHESPTIPDEMGVFLGTTYRMHSAINQFISAAIYDNKLISDSDNDRQIIQVPEGYTGILNQEAGIIFVPVVHEGNTQAADEEVHSIKQLAAQLLGRIFFDKQGNQRPIDWSDMLFVAPYNHQVNRLKEALGKQAKVGSVDKFQGQEAPIVFLSMCASDAAASPRGLKFLFDKHRINVAISRA